MGVGFLQDPAAHSLPMAQPDTFDQPITAGYRLCFWQLTPMGDGIEWTAEEQQPDPPKQVEWGGRLEHEDGSGQWQPITTPPFSVEVYFEFTFHWPPLDLEAAGGQVLPAHQPQAREPGKHVQLLGRPRFQPFRTSESQHFILEVDCHKYIAGNSPPCSPPHGKALSSSSSSSS
jgi:hypothetical protein